MHDEQRPNFRLAVMEAEGVHKIVSTHPVFFYWLHDPNKEIAHMKHKADSGVRMDDDFCFYQFLYLNLFVNKKWSWEVSNR